MDKVDTNVFPITNLNELSSQYQQYMIKGLSPTHPDYYHNRQILQKQLSYQLQNPVLVIERDDLPYLVVRSDMQYKLQPRFVIASGKAVSFESRFEPQPVDYTTRSKINDAICLRFLQFAIQGVVQQHHDLWQTQSGRPFFKKVPAYTSRNRQRFSGFAVRPMVIHDGGIGLCVDMTSKTISRYPLPKTLSRDAFHKWQGQHCIYHYGSDWYEIQIASLGETYSEHLLVLEGGKVISLQEFITQNADEPLPPELAQLSPDTSVVTYFNNRGGERAAPTSLCYPIYGTDDAQTGQEHRGTLFHAHDRYGQILETVNTYLSNLSMGDTPIQIANQPITKPAEQRAFRVPDLRFGNNKILSVRGTPGAQQTSLNQLGQSRLDLLNDKDAGFFVSRSLDQQYLILPLSVYRSWGKVFAEDLKKQMASQYPTDKYDPQVVYYDDSGKRTYVQQGRKLKKFIQRWNWSPGFAVVMIHHTDDKQVREEDKLGALALRELRQRGVHGAVIHSVKGSDCYEYHEGQNGEASYVWPDEHSKRSQLTGYIRNVVLNKILLTNSIWPFILETPLHADITIGLDVKGSSTSLIVVGKRGGRIRRSPIYESKQREKLLDGQARKYFLEVLQEELRSLTLGEIIRHIVVHRDGTAYDSEICGIRAAIEELKQAGELPKDATLTILEIAKSAMVSVRLFDITRREDRDDWIVNPEVGESYCVGRDAYLCTTGRAFERRGKQKGTSQPLHVCLVEGEMDFEQCLEDVYALSTLAWTRPEDCSRFPITIRLNDRFLREEPTDYDQETLEFSYERQEGPLS